MKENLGQGYVKRGLLTIFPSITGKNDSFPDLTLLFHPPLPKIWLSHLHKNYIFEISNNRAIR